MSTIERQAAVAWVKHRGGETRSRNRPLITLRRSSIAFNSAFIAQNELADKSRVTIYVERARRQLGFQFHDDHADYDSYSLSQDGGRREVGRNRGRNRVCQASTILAQPWLKSALRYREDPRFVPKWEAGPSLWVIDIGPTFEQSARTADEIPSEVTGVYMYLDDDEIVYIGRGALRSRARESGREDWSFSEIRYTILNNPDAERQWEAVVIDEYEAKHGRLPRENRVRGSMVTTGEPEAAETAT